MLVHRRVTPQQYVVGIHLSMSMETKRPVRLVPFVITAYLTPKIGQEIKLLLEVVNICSEIVDQDESFVLIS